MRCSMYSMEQYCTICFFLWRTQFFHFFTTLVYDFIAFIFSGDIVNLAIQLRPVFVCFPNTNQEVDKACFVSSTFEELLPLANFLLACDILQFMTMLLSSHRSFIILDRYITICIKHNIYSLGLLAHVQNWWCNSTKVFLIPVTFCTSDIPSITVTDSCGSSALVQHSSGVLQLMQP